MSVAVAFDELRLEAPPGWDAGLQLSAPAPPDDDDVRPVFSLRRLPLRRDRAATVDAALRALGDARLIGRRDVTLGGREGTLVEVAIPARVPLVERLFFTASERTLSVLAVTARLARLDEVRLLHDATVASLDGKTGRGGPRLQLGSTRVFLLEGWASDAPAVLLGPPSTGYRANLALGRDARRSVVDLAAYAQDTADELRAGGAAILHEGPAVLAGRPGWTREVAHVAGETPVFTTEGWVWTTRGVLICAFTDVETRIADARATFRALLAKLSVA